MIQALLEIFWCVKYRLIEGRIVKQTDIFLVFLTLFVQKFSTVTNLQAYTLINICTKDNNCDIPTNVHINLSYNTYALKNQLKTSNKAL